MAALTESFVSGGIFGETTKALRQSWNQRVVETDQDILVDELNIRQLFNDLNLFPSKSQVFEMVHCAREGSKDERSDFLTFGEFCIFATELRKYYDQHNVILSPKPLPYKLHSSGSSVGNVGNLSTPENMASGGQGEKEKVKKNGSCSYDVFLGGSCNPTVWRKDQAIPHFKSRGITFYNPYNPTITWVPEMIELEHQAKQTSQILFYVADEKTRNVATMIEISYLAGKKRKLICYLGKYPQHNHSINNEPIGKNEWQDLQGGMTVVNDLVERQGIPVFDSIDIALECATRVIKEGLALEDLGLRDGARPVQHAELQIGDKLVRLREAFDAVDTSQSGTIGLTDLKMAFRIYVHRDLTGSDLKNIASYLKADGSSTLADGASIDFNKFCCIVADFRQKKQKHSVEDRNANPSAASASVNSPASPHLSGGSGVEKPEKGSKRKRVKNFFSKVFHRNLSGHGGQEGSVSLLVTSKSTDVKVTADSDGSSFPNPLLRDVGGLTTGCSMKGAGAALQTRRGSNVRDIYLGGSANGSWRHEIAVPMLKKHGLTYFNPQCITRRLMPMWAAAIDNSRVLLFVILGNSRSLAAMNEAAFYIGQSGTSVVLVVQSISPETEVSTDAYQSGLRKGKAEPGEVLTKHALKDYNRGRSYLSDIANREGVPVFDNVTEAVQCVVDKCKNTAGQK